MNIKWDPINNYHRPDMDRPLIPFIDNLLRILFVLGIIILIIVIVSLLFTHKIKTKNERGISPFFFRFSHSKISYTLIKKEISRINSLNITSTVFLQSFELEEVVKKLTITIYCEVESKIDESKDNLLLDKISYSLGEIKPNEKVGKDIAFSIDFAEFKNKILQNNFVNENQWNNILNDLNFHSKNKFFDIELYGIIKYEYDGREDNSERQYICYQE